jgi:hypothetical protein
MPDPERTSSLRQWLFGAPEGQAVLAVIDGASIPGLRQQMSQLAARAVCLLPGELSAELQDAAPYLVRLEAEGQFTTWLLEAGWGRHWGIYLTSGANERALRQHLRSLLTVYGPDGRPLFFRFYDPRVLRAYLRTCVSDELDAVFGPVDRLLLEGEDPRVLVRYELKESGLAVSELPLAPHGERS